MSETIELCLKGKVLPPLSPSSTIQPMALTYQKKTQTMEIILRTAQSRPANQHITIYYNLTQVIINQKHNIIKTVKNAIIEIEKDSELKKSLENKE